MYLGLLANIGLNGYTVYNIYYMVTRYTEMKSTALNTIYYEIIASLFTIHLRRSIMLENTEVYWAT